MGRNKVDLAGQRFGHLTVLSQVPDVSGRRTRGKPYIWLCQCDCGTFVSVPTPSLTRHGQQTCEKMRCPYYEEERLEAREHDRAANRRWKQNQARKAAEEQGAPVTYQHSAGKPKPRTCHDCGKPCVDFRCPKCLAKWRKKNHVSPDTTYYAD